MHDATKSTRCKQDMGLGARKAPRVESPSDDAHTDDECRPVLPLRALLVKHHLATVNVSGPFIKGEYASELFQVFDISDPRNRQPVMDFFVHDKPRAELQAGCRRHVHPSKLKFDLEVINGLGIDLDDEWLGDAQSNHSGRMPCQVLVGQHPRGLWIVFLCGELSNVQLTRRAGMNPSVQDF